MKLLMFSNARTRSMGIIVHLRSQRQLRALPCQQCCLMKDRHQNHPENTAQLQDSPRRRRARFLESPLWIAGLRRYRLRILWTRLPAGRLELISNNTTITNCHSNMDNHTCSVNNSNTSHNNQGGSRMSQLILIPTSSEDGVVNQAVARLRSMTLPSFLLPVLVLRPTPAANRKAGE